MGRLAMVAREGLKGKSLGRTLMNLAVQEAVRLKAPALDVGGRGLPSYRRFLNGSSGNVPLKVLNLEPGPHVDVVGSVESMPLPDAGFETVLCFNVLEHVYDHRRALAELRRVLRPGGTLYGYVPFLANVHADPVDHWRFTRQTLERLLEEAGFKSRRVSALGGLFAALSDISHPLWRLGPLQAASAALALCLDGLLDKAAPRHREAYVLGYFFEAS